ncbi:MAG TPA: serine hydrolase domain-containing protein [Saprospiraceae bacterium]|nr:serine hydrolase domain-containing protein [Saprospiraceae bacterium]
MKRIAILLPALLIILSGFGQSGPIPERNWQLVRDYVTQQKEFSGIIVMGTEGKVKINLASGFADRSREIPFTDSSLYTIGSITKPITATAILLLSGKGKLDLEDKITLYFKNIPGDKQDITIHHLLTHSSGLPGAIGDDYEKLDALKFQARAWDHPLLFAPGSGYEYSNVGYSLLGMIIEQVSGQTYSQFLQGNIFQPAGMTTAGYRNPEADYSLLCHGYNPDGSDWGTSHDKQWDKEEPYWNLKANGGILMSAIDMYHWYLALRNHTILSPELLKLQTNPYVNEGGGSYYGYGYAVDQQGDCVQHNGSNRIFKADFRWFPKADFFLFAATNDANVRLFRLNDEIIQILKSGELPEQDQWKEIHASDFPLDSNQYTADAFIQLIKSYTNEKADAFIASHISSAMLERNGKERLLDLFSMLHGDINPDAAFRAYASGQKIQLIIRARDENANLKMTLSMNDHKLDRLSAEIEGI